MFPTTSAMTSPRVLGNRFRSSCARYSSRPALAPRSLTSWRVLGIPSRRRDPESMLGQSWTRLMPNAGDARSWLRRDGSGAVLLDSAGCRRQLGNGSAGPARSALAQRPSHRRVPPRAREPGRSRPLQDEPADPGHPAGVIGARRCPAARRVSARRSWVPLHHFHHPSLGGVRRCFALDLDLS